MGLEGGREGGKGLNGNKCNANECDAELDIARPCFISATKACAERVSATHPRKTSENGGVRTPSPCSRAPVCTWRMAARPNLQRQSPLLFFVPTRQALSLALPSLRDRHRTCGAKLKRRMRSSMGGRTPAYWLTMFCLLPRVVHCAMGTPQLSVPPSMVDGRLHVHILCSPEQCVRWRSPLWIHPSRPRRTI